MRLPLLLVQGTGLVGLAHGFAVPAWGALSATLQRKSVSFPIYYVSSSSIISSPSQGDPVRSILNRAVLLYDQLASLESSSTLNQYLSDQLTTMIVTMARHLRESDQSVNINDRSEMTNEQLQILTAILDTMERQIVQQQQELSNSQAEGWRALYQAAQLIERAMLENVPYTQVRALVESYANVKASLEQQQIQKKAAEEASFAELWQKVAPFVPSRIDSSVPQTPVRTNASPSTAAVPSNIPSPTPPDTASQSEDFSTQKDDNSDALQMGARVPLGAQDTKSPTAESSRMASVPPSTQKLEPTPPKEMPPEQALVEARSSIAGFDDPSVTERNRLARQLEEALLNDTETADPVQVFLDSLNTPAPPPSQSASPQTPSNPFQNSAVQKQMDMAKRLEEALLADGDDNNETDPVKSFLASIQNLGGDDKLAPKESVASDSAPRDQSFEDRIESFVQNLRQIRNVDVSDLEYQSPTAETSDGGRRDSRDAAVGGMVEASPSKDSDSLSFDQTESDNYETQEVDSTESSVPTFYFANTTFYFANTTVGDDSSGLETSGETKVQKQELEKMENHMIDYLEAARPTAVDRTLQFAKDLAVTATPVVDKGVSSARTSLRKACVGLYSAAKTIAQQKWAESVQTRKNDSNKMDSPNGDLLRPVQTALDNLFPTIQIGQLNLPFRQENDSADSSSDLEADADAKDGVSDENILADMIPEVGVNVVSSEMDVPSDKDEAEKTGATKGFRQQSGEDAGTLSEMAKGEQILEVDSQFSTPSMEELAKTWAQMNRDTALDTSSNMRLGISSLPIASSKTENEIPPVSKDLTRTEPGEGMRTGGSDSVGTAESLEQDDSDRIEALKAKLGYSSKDDTERKSDRDPRTLEDALADIRIKLATRGDIGTASVEESPSKFSTASFTQTDGQTTEDSPISIGVETRSLSKWETLAKEWKERNSETNEGSTVGVDFSSPPKSTGGAVPNNRNKCEELAEEWKKRNSSE